MDKNSKALDFELKISDILSKSNRRAWIITFIALLSTALMAFLYLYKPMIKTVPYVVKIDKEGVPSLLNSMQSKNIKIDEGLDKYFTREYVTKREGYYYSLIEQDYLYIQLLSNAEIAKKYRAIYAGEKSRDKVLKDTTTVSVKIISITLGVSAGIKNATIRIKTLQQKQNAYDIEKHIVINLSYQYNPSEIMSEKDRLVNPLGYKVISYRKDEEIL